jgi:hypothetical protein
VRRHIYRQRRGDGIEGLVGVVDDCIRSCILWSSAAMMPPRFNAATIRVAGCATGSAHPLTQTPTKERASWPLPFDL